MNDTMVSVSRCHDITKVSLCTETIFFLLLSRSFRSTFTSLIFHFKQNKHQSKKQTWKNTPFLHELWTKRGQEKSYKRKWTICFVVCISTKVPIPLMPLFLLLPSQSSIRIRFSFALSAASYGYSFATVPFSVFIWAIFHFFTNPVFFPSQ